MTTPPLDLTKPMQPVTVERDCIALQQAFCAMAAIHDPLRTCVADYDRDLEAMAAAVNEFLRVYGMEAYPRKPTIEWRELAEEANDLLRSAYQIASRSGAGTNWLAFQRRLTDYLAKFHLHQTRKTTTTTTPTITPWTAATMPWPCRVRRRDMQPPAWTMLVKADEEGVWFGECGYVGFDDLRANWLHVLPNGETGVCGVGG